MSFFKDLWIETFDTMVEEYLIEHPDVSYNKAYDIVANIDKEVQDRYADKVGGLIDDAKEQAKAEGNWPPTEG